MHGLLSFYLTFWTTLAPLVLFCNFFLENLFKVFLQIVKGIWIRLREEFSRFEILPPCFKCFSFDLNKTPLNKILLLVFKRVLIDTNFESKHTKIYQLKINIPIWNISTKRFYHKIPIEKTNINHHFEIFWRLVVRSFCFGLILSPLWHESPKTETLWALLTFSSIGK
jgi:hypothetical protein